MRRVVVTLLALAVLLPSIAFGRGQYRCTIDQRVRETCCCPAKHQAQPPTGPAMHAECCLQVQHEASLTQSADLDPPSAPSAPSAFTIIEPPRFTESRTIASTIVQRANAPPDRPSLYDQHCALLL